MKTVKEYIVEAIVKHNIKNVNKDAGKPTKKGVVKNIEDIEVGDVLYSVFQYNSRHVYFWQVKAVRGKSTVVVNPIEQEVIKGAYNSPMGCEVMPVMSKVDTHNDIKARITIYGLKIKNLSTYFWDGEPQTEYCD